jgi:hypothetical protein
LAGDAGIDSDADDSQPTEKRHRNLNSYFSDEENNESSPSGGEEVEQETQDSEGCKTAKDAIQKRNSLWIHSSCLLSLTQGSSCVIKRDTKNPLQGELVVMSPLMASTPTASSSGRFTIPPKNPPQKSEVQFVRRTVKSKIQWTPTNG